MTKQKIRVGEEVISVPSAMGLVKMIQKDAHEMAGVFHGMQRSDKFRANWPNEDQFAATNWKSFVAAVRQIYSERLGNPKTPSDDARKMYLALLLERAWSEGQLALGMTPDMQLQLSPGTQQFEGDAGENKKIAERFGGRPNLRALLKAGAAKMGTIH
jgi:hypothetical protein